MDFYKNILFIILCIKFYSETYKILAIFPLNPRSHNIMLEAIVKGLAKNGHNVDVISHYELKNSLKNYKTIINLNNTLKSSINFMTIDFAFEIEEYLISLIATNGNQICELMAHKEMQKFIKNLPNYDVVITEVKI